MGPRDGGKLAQPQVLIPQQAGLASFQGESTCVLGRELKCWGEEKDLGKFYIRGTQGKEEGQTAAGIGQKGVSTGY